MCKKPLSRLIAAFFLGLSLFFCYGLSFASTGNDWDIAGGPTPVASHTDLSVAYLAQVFGTVGDSLQGTSGQMLGMLFSKLNQGIMVVSGIWLIYTVMTIILRSAMDGSFMGQNKNVFWIVIRIALGFAMLIPGPMTGYNVIQDIIMKVVIQGVSLADQTWNYGLDYIASGGSLWHPPETTAQNGNAIVTKDQAAKILTPMESIFRAEVCMVNASIQNANKVEQNGGGSSVANINTHSPLVYHVVEDDQGGHFAFPGTGNTDQYDRYIKNGQETPQCGFVDWNAIPGAQSSPANQSPNLQNMSSTLAKMALSQAVYQLLPAAQRYACALHGSPDVCSGIDTTPSDLYPGNQTAVFNALVNYVNAVYPIAQQQNEGAATDRMNWFEDARNSGWMVAGRYYWDLARIQSYASKVSDIATFAPPAVDNSNNTDSSSSNQDDPLHQAWGIYVNGNTSYSNGALNQLVQYQGASHAGAVTNMGTNANKIRPSNHILNLFGVGIISDVMSLVALFSPNGAGPVASGMVSDPVLFLHMLGTKCIEVGSGIWITSIGISFALALASMFCESMTNLDTPLAEVLGWLKPAIMLLIGVLLGVGVLLGYYLPLYPFLLFTFGIIGWIIAVIEAMVAGPLIAFGLTQPEGHDFLGEAKQALILLLGLFLRPVLMLLGLISGMILSYVSLRILVYTYSGFLRDIFANSSVAGSTNNILSSAATAAIHSYDDTGAPLSSAMTVLITFPMMLVIFSALVYIVTNQCFSLIYVLPDYVLRWIGAPTQPLGMSGSEMANFVRGAAGGVGDTVGNMMKSSSDAKDRQDDKKKLARKNSENARSLDMKPAAGKSGGGESKATDGGDKEET